MEPLPTMRVSAAARLDRVPIGSFHRRMMWLLGLTFFFELGDINTFSFAAPAIMKAWNLSILRISFIVSATFFGMFVGAMLGGWLCDRLGRKRALIITTLWYSGFSLLNALVDEPVGLFFARLLTGVGLSSMTVIAITYISEMFPVTSRGAYQGWIMTIGLAGIPVTAYVARFCIPMADWGWRLVFVWGSLGIFFPLFSHLLEESPRWLESQGRLAEADAVLARIEERTRAEGGILPPARETVGTPRVGRRGYAELFSASSRKVSIVLTVAWVAEMLGFYGFTSWVPTLLVARGFSLVKSLTWSSAISVGAVPGALIAALIAERWERRWSLSTVAVAIATCGVLYGMSSSTYLVVIFGFLVAMLLQTCASLMYAYVAESFPTESRSSGVGLAYGSGRLANVVGPVAIASIYTHFGYTSVFVFIGMLWLVHATMIGGFGPSTKGRVLA